MSYFHNEPLIDSVTERNVLGDLARVADGTSIARCQAVYRNSIPTLHASTAYDGWTYLIEKFTDGSRRLYVTGPNGETGPLDNYPLGPHEYLEDVEGIPASVLDDLATTWIPRVRASAARRVHHWVHGEGGANIAPALVIDRGVPGQTFAVVFSDGSAIGPGNYPLDSWLELRAGLDARIASELVVADIAPGHEELADAVRRAIERVAASA
jgi:hypothetical protein